jgi:hypothetical protein
VPEERFPEEWTDGATGNPVLAEMFCNQLQARYQRDSVQGSMPPFRHIYEPFRWPKNQKSKIMPADPFSLNLRHCPIPAGVSFYTIKEIPLKVT